MSVWDKRITKAEKFLDPALQHGRNVYRRYEDKRDDAQTRLKRVNLFYANVNTIKESLFNSMPKPDVSRLHKGDYEDDVARVAALVLQRALTYEINCAESFQGAVKAAILDRLVPGIGQVWIRFEKAGEQPEAIFIDLLYWEDFIYGPARSWEAVPWVGRRHEFDKEAFVEAFGEDALTNAAQVKNDDGITPPEITEGKYCVYEIWHKKSKKVFHILKGAEKPLKEIDDPYQLPGFWPCPKPLIANPTTASFLPVTDYHLAQDQYNELDVLYARMSLIAKAVKVAGCYDSSEKGIGSMLEGQENKLIPVENWAMFAEKGGAKGMIDWYPVEVVVQVFQALSAQYEMIKAVLYEVSGMSDIMRGASNQYETAEAQKIKSQFASVRMNGYQRDVSEFVRDIIRIMSALMCKLYSDQKFMSIIGTFNEADQQLLPQAAQVLRNDIMRHYKVDVEADSLTQADWALEKGQRMEVTGYIGQLLTSAVPAVAENPELGPLMLALIKFSVAGFKGAAEIEGILDQQLSALIAKAAKEKDQPPKPTPEEQKAQLEQQQMQAQMQLDAQKMQAEMQMEQQRFQMQSQLDQQQGAQKMQIEQQQMQADIAIKQLEMAHTREINEMDLQIKAAELQFKQQEAVMKLQVQREQHAMDAQHTAVKNQQALDQQQQAGDLKNEQLKQQPKGAKDGKPTPKN